MQRRHDPDQVRGASEGGVAAAHVSLPVLPALVGPSTEGQKNTVRIALVPIACWRVDDLRFTFDSSVIGPGAIAEFHELARLIDEHTDRDRTPPRRPPVTLFGHADPIGDDDYNKVLSGRRAAAVYAVLVRQPERWEDLFTNPAGGDDWGLRAIKMMLAALGLDPGPVDGEDTPQTKSAVTSFQQSHGLAPDGIAGPLTRRQLFLEYMDLLAGADFVLDTADFLARGADAGGKGDFQGCGEFNPVLMFSQAEKEAFDDTARNAANAPNRRVLALLFRPGSKVDPANWPCPRASEGTAKCHARFWSDQAARRSFGPARREFKTTRDTFACRFYERLFRRSPCEDAAVGQEICFVFATLYDGQSENVLADTPYTLRGISGGATIAGRTNAGGVLRHDFLSDDHYEIEVSGKRERVETYYMMETERYDGAPWPLRMRGV